METPNFDKGANEKGRCLCMLVCQVVFNINNSISCTFSLSVPVVAGGTMSSSIIIELESGEGQEGMWACDRNASFQMSFGTCFIY